MLNALPAVGWFMSFVLAAVMAVPLWYLWTVCGLGEIYGTALPEAWRALPYWHCVGLIVCASIVRAVLVPMAYIDKSALSKSRN